MNQMATRKPVPIDVQKQVLLSSRRRCCLCFWLNGIDEVVKGQIAHLDGDPANNEYNNLAFLCFAHHDEFDSRASTSKGLQDGEVRQWRDELTKEMAYRFRTVKSRRLELAIRRFLDVGNSQRFKIEFRLKNVGESEVRNVTVSIRLPLGVTGKVPKEPPAEIEGPAGYVIRMPELPDMYGMAEIREDFFEVNGRVGTIDPLPRFNPLLLPEHSILFEGLGCDLSQYPEGSSIILEYRIDAEEMEPYLGRLEGTVPTGLEWVLERKEEYGLPEGVTIEQLEERFRQST
jgi:hypothetical protein